MQRKSNFRIEIADTKDKYEGLRTLWCEVFNDEESFIDGLYAFFGANPREGAYASEAVKGYVCLDENDKVISALTCFRSGDFEGRPAYTSYAICTDPACRGLGLAGALVEHVRDIVLKEGAVSIISPAEPSLEEFYGAHGYRPFFFAKACEAETDDGEAFIFDEEDSEYEKFHPHLVAESLEGDEFNRYREEFLSGRSHLKLSEEMIALIYNESRLPDGSCGLMLINKGDAICAMGEAEDGGQEIAELLVNPKLLQLSPEIEGEIAGRIAEFFGKESIAFHAPGAEVCQSMIAGLDADKNEEAYYGFPIN